MPAEGGSLHVMGLVSLVLGDPQGRAPGQLGRGRVGWVQPGIPRGRHLKGTFTAGVERVSR